MLDYSQLPSWLEALFEEKFFNACLKHPEGKRNEKNICCLDCCQAICLHCLSGHSSHRLLQIRKYMYRDVLRIIDAGKLIDCSNVQCYTTNGHKVLFLQPRPQSRPARGTSNFCIICGKGLQPTYAYCSLYCKLEHLQKIGTKPLKFIYKCEVLTLPAEPGPDEELLTPESVLEPSGSVVTESCSTSSIGAVDCRMMASTATTEIVRKKRSSMSSCRPAFPPAHCAPVYVFSDALMNRRKGTPHRSPLY